MTKICRICNIEPTYRRNSKCGKCLYKESISTPGKKEKQLANQRKWSAKNKNKISEYNSTHWAELRRIVFEHYGFKCACPPCGETIEAFLEVDHINDDGAKHRAEIGKAALYRWIIKNNFPDYFQLLCSNCNSAKERVGICPHMQMVQV